MDEIDTWIICGGFLAVFVLLALCNTYLEWYKDEKSKREKIERDYHRVCKERDDLLDQLNDEKKARPERPVDIIVIEKLFGGNN